MVSVDCADWLILICARMNVLSDLVLVDRRRRECVGEYEDCQQRQQQQSRAVKERHGSSYARIVEFNATSGREY